MFLRVIQHIQAAMRLGSAALNPWLRAGTYTAAGLAASFLLLLPLVVLLFRRIKAKKSMRVPRQHTRPFAVPQDAENNPTAAWVRTERQAVFMQKVSVSGDPHTYLKKTLAACNNPHRLSALRAVDAELSLERARAAYMSELASEPAFFEESSARTPGGRKSLKMRTQNARAAYKKSISNGTARRIPMLTFRLSRQDLFSLAARIHASNTYPVPVRAVSGTDGDAPDEIAVGKWTAALIYAYADAFCLVLAADETHIRQLMRKYPATTRPDKLPGFCLVWIDGSFAEKPEVFRLIEDAVCHTYYARYSVFYGEAETDEEDARAEAERIAALSAALVPVDDLIGLAAERRQALALWRRSVRERWELNEVVEILACFQSKSITVSMGKHWYEPVLVSVDRIPFLRLIMQEGSPVFCIKLSETLEKKISVYHAELRRCDGDADWFILPVTGAFRTAAEIKTLIQAAAKSLCYQKTCD